MKAGRNDPCTCGSGKKYKKCCMSTAGFAIPAALQRDRAAITLAQREQLLALFNSGQYATLESLASRLIEHSPQAGFAWKLLGVSRFTRGLDGVPALARAAELSPDDVECHNILGSALLKVGQLGEAEACFRRALGVKPDYAGAHFNLAMALSDLGRGEESVASCRRALAIKPDYAEAHYQLGRSLSLLGRPDDAAASLRRALAIRPNFVEAHTCLGGVLKDCGQLEAAMASIRRALEIQPDYAMAQDNLLFLHNYQSAQTPSLLLSEARRYGEVVTQTARPFTHWNNTPEPVRCLRVGLISGDFRQHPVGYFLEGVLAMLKAQASDRLVLFAYPSAVCNDALSERIKACCQAWQPAVGLADARLAQRLRDDGIDILIDLAGHTEHNRLPVFAWRPAPVQVSWLGYFATTGVAAMDYLIADPWTLPESEERYFTEKIWRLPETRMCFTPPDVDVAVSPLPALANGYVTFACFNNLAKMNDAVVALWARILTAVPASRLLLKARELLENSARESVIARFGVHGVAASRLILARPAPRPDYLAAYGQADIVLDPFPYPGGTTTVEALWMGVPVLTLHGERFLSRQGSGLLMNAGLPEWIATDADDYVARALSHASDWQALAALRGGLRQQVLASPLFDAARFAAHFEAALRSMWHEWCARVHA